MFFRPEDMGMGGESLRSSFVQRGKSTFIMTFRGAISDSRASHLEAANSADHPGEATLDSEGRLVVREHLIIDPRIEMLSMEALYRNCPTVAVNLNCWVHPSRGDERLKCAIWQVAKNDGEVGILVINDPSKDDRGRKKIRVVGPSLKSAREVLMGVLKGDIEQENFLII